MATDEHPFALVLQRLGKLGAQIKHRPGDRVRATCPAHSDTKPSLSVARRDRCVLLHCHAGCRTGEVVRALGLRPADLFIGPRPPRERESIVETYDYLNRDGELLAQKVRYQPKRFKWRRLDPDTPSGWRWDLGEGGLPRLYRWPELAGARLVFIAEGEKAVDRLKRFDLLATCGPAGASTWKASEQLLEAVASDATIAILPDHDRPGARHADRVATDLHEHRRNTAIVLKLVQLEVPPGGDVVDWFDRGGTRERLLDLVASTLAWSPGAAARQRAKHRADLARARKRTQRTRVRAERAMMHVDETRDAPRPDLRQVDAVGAALRAVVVELERAGEPQSGRDLKAALVGRHARNIVDAALRLGREPGGALMWEAGPRGAMLYRVGTLEHSPDIHRVTDRAGHSGSVPSVNDERDTQIGNVPEQSECPSVPVTLSRSHAGERSSLTLQDDPLTKQTYKRDRGTRDTESVTNRRDTQTPGTAEQREYPTSGCWEGPLPRDGTPPFGISREAWARHHRRAHADDQPQSVPGGDANASGEPNRVGADVGQSFEK